MSLFFSNKVHERRYLYIRKRQVVSETGNVHNISRLQLSPFSNQIKEIEGLFYQ